jgi:hypothetical protein
MAIAQIETGNMVFFLGRGFPVPCATSNRNPESHAKDALAVQTDFAQLVRLW